MKRTFLLFLPTLLLAGLSIASAQDSTSRRESRPEQSQSKQNAATKFVDENGDGIDDGAQRRNRQKPGAVRGEQRAQFIDADGDGICDQRSGVIGIRYRGGRATGTTGGLGKGQGKGR